MNQANEYEYVVHLIQERKPGWDTQAAAMIVQFIYGDMETFIKSGLPILEKKAKHRVHHIPVLEEL
jgi:hypothetical protein